MLKPLPQAPEPKRPAATIRRFLFRLAFLAARGLGTRAAPANLDAAARAPAPRAVPRCPVPEPTPPLAPARHVGPCRLQGSSRAQGPSVAGRERLGGAR